MRFSRVNPVKLLASGPGVAGNAFSLSRSATVIDPIALPSNVPSPTFEWFFGPDTNASLPSGVIPTDTLWTTGNTYSSTLLFSPVLNVFHAGMYTCRIGAGRLANSTVVSVDGMHQKASLIIIIINAQSKLVHQGETITISSSYVCTIMIIM